MTDPASAAVDSAAASNGVSNGKKTNQLADLDRFNPLRSSTDNEDDDDDHDDLRPLDDSELSSASYLARLAGVACLLGLQFGWDTGIASGMLVAIHADLGHDLSEGEQELIVSATTVGAILGSIVAGRMADWLGRKKVMVGAGILFLLGAMEQAASQVVRELVLGRVLVGLGVGMASMVVPTYLAEIAPTKVRGRIIGINSLLITGGQVIAYLIDAAFYNLPHGWRWMVLAGGVPAIFQLIGMIYLDESPRWLVARGRIIRARHVLQRIYPRASVRAIDNEIERIARSMEGTTQRDAVDPDSAHAADPQQLVGFNSLMYFSGRLLLMAGFVLNPNAAAVGIAIANFVGTLIAMRYIDIWGRRKLLLYTTAAMTFFLSLVAIGFSQIDLGPITGGPPTTTTTTTTTTPTSAWPYLTLAFMILFTLSYALGLGIVPWLIQSEIFSGQVRGVGAGLATATNWSTNLLISSTFLHMVKWIRPQGCFGLFSVVAALSWAFTYWQLPEMAGVSLSDVGGEAEREVYRAVPAEEESD
uniref:Major facilitator superfamily (MFS) profile domain-containing protein n=1 Tax=Kalmanozyma brasiliensis (strain GHG001) TaxID=1365824 RepID=V5GJV6_KALBG